MAEQLKPVKWIHRTGPFPYVLIPSPDDFYIQPGSEKRLIILFPGLSESSFSGGPNTILRFAGEAAKRGVHVICVSLQTPAVTPEAFQAHLQKNLNIPAEAASRMEAWAFKEKFRLNRGDRIMATASWTFPLAKVLAKKCGLAEPAYFIQDLEPLFQGLSLNHAHLMQTYYERHLPIINTPSLGQALFDLGAHSFATQEFKNKALFFQPGVDRKLFYPQERPEGKKTLFLYTRLGDQESRNMAELALEAVNRMAWEGRLDPEEWEVHCYGAPEAAPFKLANGMLTKMLPSLSLPEYAREIRSASLGMTFVLSPHPGYMAFELAASGVPVITNTYLNKTAAYFKGISPLIYPAEPSFDAVTTKLRNMLLEKKYRGSGELPAQSAINLPENWSDSFAPIMPAFMRWYEED